MAVNGIGMNDEEIKQETVPTISNNEGGVSGVPGIDPLPTNINTGTSFQSVAKPPVRQETKIGEIPTIQEIEPFIPRQETKVTAPTPITAIEPEKFDPAKVTPIETPQPDIKVDEFKAEKPKDEKKGPPGVVESDFDKFVSQEDLDKKRAELNSIYDISEAKDDIEARKLEELREFDVRNRIQQQEDEQLLTKRLKEAGNFGQGIGNSLTRSFLRDANLNATTAQGEIINSFKNELSDIIRKNVDDINSELSDFARQEQAEIKQRRLDDINLNIDIMNSLAPDDAIEFAIMASEIYPEVSTFAKFKNPEFQEYWKNANSEQMKEFVKQIGEDANSIVISFVDNHKGTPREGLEEERAKRDLKEAYKREGEGYYVKFENWMNDLIKDPSYLNSIYSKEEAKEIIDIINTGDQEAAEEAYINYKWDSLMNNQFKTSLVGIVEDFQPRNDAEADFVKKLSDNFANGNFKGKIRIDDDTSLSYELPDGKKVTDPREMPGFDVLFEDWDREPYGDDRSMENDPLYFEWLTDKYIDYINNLDEGATPVSRWEFRDNMETYLNAEASGSGIANAGSDPAGVNINLLPDLRGSELASVAGTGVKPSVDDSTFNSGRELGSVDKVTLQDISEDGKIQGPKVDKVILDLVNGNLGVNDLDEAALRNVYNTPGFDSESIKKHFIRTGTEIVPDSEFNRTSPIGKSGAFQNVIMTDEDFSKEAETINKPKFIFTEDGQLLKQSSELVVGSPTSKGIRPRFMIKHTYTDLDGKEIKSTYSGFASASMDDLSDIPDDFTRKRIDESFEKTINIAGEDYKIKDIVMGNTPYTVVYDDFDGKRDADRMKELFESEASKRISTPSVGSIGSGIAGLGQILA